MKEYTPEQVKKRVFWLDLVTGVSLFMMIMCRVFTSFSMAKIQEITKTSIENVVKVTEANVFAQATLNLSQIGFVITNMILPATCLATYVYFRRKALEGKINVEYVVHAVTLTFFMLLLNMVNDGAMLFGLLAR